MSPVEGVGINPAVADAVAAARILAGPLRSNRVSTRQLARVQPRRWLPTVLPQAAQRAIRANVIAAAVTAGGPGSKRGAPRAVRLVGHTAALRRFVGYPVAVGPLPEHAPAYARRPG